MRAVRITFFVRWLLVALLICFVLAGPRATAAVTALSGHSVHFSPVTLHKDQAHWSANVAHTVALDAVVPSHVAQWVARPAAAPPAGAPASTATGRAPPGRVA
jgi:hypothetical protein